jgi:hypothetical protein
MPIMRVVYSDRKLLTLGLIVFIASVSGCGDGTTGESNLPVPRTAAQIAKGRQEFAAKRAAAAAKGEGRPVPRTKSP